MNAWIKVAIAAALVFSGWYARIVYDGYLDNKNKTEAVTDLGKGQNEIINFNQNFDKGLADAQHEKDACVSQPIPDALRVLLSGSKGMP